MSYSFATMSNSELLLRYSELVRVVMSYSFATMSNSELLPRYSELVRVINELLICYYEQLRATSKIL